MDLSKRDCENLIDALKEWHDTCEPKELEDNEVGLNDDRYQKLMDKFLEEVLKKDNKMERIICASIHYDDGKVYTFQPVNIKTGIVVGGMRHHNCLEIIRGLNPHYLSDLLNSKHMGFLTTKNRHVSRKEAYQIAIKAGQIKKREGDTDIECLASEDLY